MHFAGGRLSKEASIFLEGLAQVGMIKSKQHRREVEGALLKLVEVASVEAGNQEIQLHHLAQALVSLCPLYPIC